MKKSLGNDKRSLNSDYIQVQNNSASAIAQGAPAIFEMDGTDDGVSVHNASDAAATTATSFLAGIAVKAIPAGARGQVQVRGFIDNLLIIRATRAASTDTFATLAAISKGQDLIINTVGNGMSLGAAGAASAELPAMACVGTTASRASSASTSSDSSLVASILIGAYLRIM